MTRAKPSTSDLVRGASYLSPLGRACRLSEEQGDLSRASEAVLVYDTPSGRAAHGSMADGFVLTRANWYVLRRLT